MLNYLALLGWSIAEDRDIFSADELVAAFDLSKVSANPARFDGRKCEAINATHLRQLAPADFAARLTTFLARAGLVGEAPTPVQRALITAAAPLVQKRVRTLGEGAGMLRFLFVRGAAFAVDPGAAAKHLGDAGRPVIEASATVLEPLPEWTAAAIEQALHAELVERLALKPRNAFGPLRVAVTGRAVSPPLFESLELLGREEALARIAAARRL